MAAFQYPGSATTDAPLDQRAERAIALAARLLANAKQQQNDQELAQGSKIARMREDPPVKGQCLSLKMIACLIPSGPLRGWTPRRGKFPSIPLCHRGKPVLSPVEGREAQGDFCARKAFLEPRPRAGEA